MTRFFLIVHKWVGIALGVLLFIWLASGVVMVLPMTLVSRNPSTADVPVAGVTLSPAQAAALVATREADTSGVREWSVVVIEGTAYYRITTPAKGNFLIHGGTGARLVIDSAAAARIALRRLPAPQPVARVSQITRYGLGYASGPLPAWRVEFADARRTIATVGVRDGSVGVATGLHRMRYFIAQMHTFDQLKSLGVSRAVQHGTLAVTSTVALLLVFTGYYLVLPRRWRRRWERHPGGAS